MSKNPSPNYILSLPSGHYFRMAVPADLAPIVGRKEIRYSLRTGFLSTAKHRARRMAGFIQFLFQNIRNGGNMLELTEAEIKNIVDKHFREVLEDIEYRSLMTKHPMTIDEHDEHLLTLDMLLSDTREEIVLKNYGNISRAVDVLLREQGIEADKGSYTYRKLCQELLKLQLKTLDIEKQCALDGYMDIEGLTKAKPESIPIEQSTTATAAETEPGTLLSEVINCYIAEQERADSWTPKTNAEVSACLALLLEFLGDVPIKSITHKTMREFKQALMKLPSNMRKTPKYMGKTVHEILTMEVDKPMATLTMNKYLACASTLFKFAMKNGFATVNPAEGMQFPKNKRDDSHRDEFNQEDLTKLFHSKEYLQDSHKASFMFWLPVLALYTGCRLEELCQLHLEDICQKDGVWVIDINHKGEKRIKTEAGERFVPLHPFLEHELKLPRYAEHLKDGGHTRLFPELKQLRDGYGAAASKWFARYRKALGVTGDKKKKVFHSFRHTFLNSLKHNYDIDRDMIKKLGGHEGGDVTFDRYGKPYPPKALLDQVILKLNYSIDLSHLKKSKFVVA